MLFSLRFLFGPHCLLNHLTKRSIQFLTGPRRPWLQWSAGVCDPGLHGDLRSIRKEGEAHLERPCFAVRGTDGAHSKRVREGMQE